MRHWFDRTAPNLRWAESIPDKTWPDLAATLPCLCLLARRFLCIVPTSAPSERVRSGFGHVITDQSSTIDSNVAIQTAFLRYIAILSQQFHYVVLDCDLFLSSLALYAMHFFTHNSDSTPL